jgi:aminomethyltransferase
MQPKKTPLYDKHIENKGKVIDFAGWLLPVEYTSSLKEAKATRTTCGLFDASHMGEIRVQGPQALEFLQSLTPNDISIISQGQQQYNLFLNKDGGVIDDLMVYHEGKGYLCVVNASNKDKALNWLLKNQGKFNVEISDKSDETALLSLQGPTAVDILRDIVGSQIDEIKYMHFSYFDVADTWIMASRSGYTGEDGFEVYTPSFRSVAVWDLLLQKGAKHGLALCGLGSRDILRIEAGYPLYGHELNDMIDPYTASLGWVVKANKDFIAKDKLLKIKQNNPVRKRMGFVMSERAMVRQGYKIFLEDKEVGVIASGTFSPNVDKFVGMAFIDTGCNEESPIEIEVRDRRYKAKITKFPFVEVKTKYIKSNKEKANVGN